MPRVTSLREAAQNEQTFLQLNELLRLSEAENAALKAELKAINAALDDPRTDLTMTACEVISTLKEQVAQLTSTIKHAEQMEDMDKKELTLLQSKSAALVDALEAYPDFGEYFMENLEAIDMKKAALAEFKGAK